MAVKLPDEQSHPYLPGARADYTWSARFTIDPPQRFDDVVLHRLGGLVTQIAREIIDQQEAGEVVDPPEFWPISGAVLGSGDAEDRTTLVLGLDPSRSFGTPSIPRCEAIAKRITDTLGWQRQPEELPEMRVIMGRRIGYKGKEYTMEEVRGLTVARGCSDLAFTEVDLFSLRHVGELQEHREAGVIVEGATSSLDALFQVAADMGQDRLVPEITDVETQVYFQPKQS